MSESPWIEFHYPYLNMSGIVWLQQQNAGAFSANYHSSPTESESL